MPFAEISLMMVGAQHPNAGKRGQPGPNRMFEILVSRPGDPVDLRAEPDNPADDRAIANYTVGCIQIGYVAAGRTMRIRRAWEAGREGGYRDRLRGGWMTDNGRLAANHRKLNEGPLTESGVSKAEGPFSSSVDRRHATKVGSRDRLRGDRMTDSGA